MCLYFTWFLHESLPVSQKHDLTCHAHLLSSWYLVPYKHRISALLTVKMMRHFHEMRNQTATKLSNEMIHPESFPGFSSKVAPVSKVTPVYGK